MFQITSFSGPVNSWILLLKRHYNLKQASREIGKNEGSPTQFRIVIRWQAPKPLAPAFFKITMTRW